MKQNSASAGCKLTSQLVLDLLLAVKPVFSWELALNSITNMQCILCGACIQHNTLDTLLHLMLPVGVPKYSAGHGDRAFPYSMSNTASSQKSACFHLPQAVTAPRVRSSEQAQGSGKHCTLSRYTVTCLFALRQRAQTVDILFLPLALMSTHKKMWWLLSI